MVGQTTGGDSIGIDPLFCVLPNSGYIFRFSANRGLSANGICNEEFKTKPDVEISAQKKENLYEDKLIEYVLKQID